MANPDGQSLRRLLPANTVEVKWDERRGQRELPKRRRAVQTACEGCRNRKSRCSGEQPCTKCVELDQTCVFTGREHDRLKLALEQYKDTVKYIYDTLQQSAESIATEIQIMQGIARQSSDVEEFVKQIARLPNVRAGYAEGSQDVSSTVTSPFTEGGRAGSLAASPVLGPADAQPSLSAISEQASMDWQSDGMDYSNIDPSLDVPSGQGFEDLTAFIEHQFFTWNPGGDGDSQPPPPPPSSSNDRYRS